MGSGSTVVGFVSSSVLHGLAALVFILIAMGVIKWETVQPLNPVEGAIVPIDVTTFSDYSNVMAISRENALRAPEDQPEDQGAPQPDDAVEETEAIPDRNAKPQEKKPTRQTVDLDKYQGMIDRALDKPGQSKQTTSSGAETGPKPRRGAGFQNDLTVSEMDYMASRVEQCWRSNEDSINATKIVVRVQLNRNGTIKGDPVVMEPKIIGDLSTRVQARRAVNAIKECAPYTEFKRERYEYWRMFDLRMGVDVTR